MSGPIRIALADDQALVRHGLGALLNGLGRIQVVLSAEDGFQLLERLVAATVDVVVLDARMPRCSGIDVVRALRARGDRTPAILITTFDDPALLTGAVQAGAQGFLLKDAAPEELQNAIERVAAGETLFAPAPLERIRTTTPMAGETLTHLTERELAVLRLVAGGYSNKEIGRLLSISDGTVKNHLTEILRKLDARDRTHAVIKAIATRML